MTRIVVLGDLNLDIHACLREEIRRGEEVRAPIFLQMGGAAGSFARTAAGLGTEVVLIGAVGEDPGGDLLETSLQRAGVETRLMRVPMATGVVLALDQGGERGMVCSRGANEALSAQWVQEAWVRGSDHLHVSGYTLLSTGQRDAALCAMQRARREELSISFDPPPASLIEVFGVERFYASLPDDIWFFPNRSEAEQLTQEKDLEYVVGSLTRRFPVGAMTLGEQGAVAWDETGRHRACVQPVSSTDPTGAGDVYAAVFVASRLAGLSLARGNEAACQAAAGMLRERSLRRGLHHEGSPSMLDQTQRMKG